MSALGGNLKDFGIADIFQLIGQQRKSGVLELSLDKKRIEVQFDRGSIVWAVPIGDHPGAALSDMLIRCGYATSDRIDLLRRKSSASAETVKGLAVEAGFISEQEVDELEDLLTKESLFDVLRWTTGSFDFKPGDVEHDRAFEHMMGAEQILMDGLRMTDEWQSLADSIPSEDTVFKRSSDFASGTCQTLGLNPRISLEKAERVSQLIDGRASVRRVIDLSRVGTFDAMQVIVAMCKAGRIEAITPSRLTRRVPLPHRKRQLRGMLAAVLPVLLLLAVSFATFQRSNPNFWKKSDVAAGLGFALDRKPLESVRNAYAEMRTLHVIEDIRMATGHWPRDWSEIEQHRLPGRIALAAADSPPYYYVRRENGVVLLAPPR